MGTGKMMVELFSLAIDPSVCRYRSCMACDPDAISSPAAFKNFADFSSPSDLQEKEDENESINSAGRSGWEIT